MNKKVPIEDIPLNKFHKKLTFYSAGGPFLDGYVLSIIGVVMLQMSEALQMSTLWQGLVAASALIGVFIGGFLGGWFTDKYGRKVLYLIDLVAIVGFSVAQFWVESVVMLFIWRLLIGIAVGADYPIATSFLAEFLPKKNRGPRLAAMVMMWFAGAAASYIVGELILQYVGGPDAWRWVLASTIIPGAIFLVARAGTPESPRWLLNKGRIKEADLVIKKVYGPEYSIEDLSEQVVDEKNKVSVWALFHSGYGKRMLFISIFWTCAIIPIYAIYSFAPQFVKALKLTGAMETWGSVAITVMFLIGCLVASLLVAVMGRKKLLFHSFLWSGLAILLLGLNPSASSLVVLILFGSFAILMGGAQVLQYVYPNELFPTEIRASAVGLGTSLSRIGATLGTYLVPFSLVTLGVSMTMIIAALICFIGAWSAWALAPDVDSMDLSEAARLKN
ncbi:MFS transporter [Acinetobacter pseudolwoffii]|uniref:MFS transporter n=1 Tax=Acinetobacter pseudolwoffii TaxID=2053287 RepID=UPI0024683646|nr:MFS transporter [Acinetobacter pseudolwoffii]MDH5818684.1 MFS transporter [Acinetobacter pseudolwoffii]